MWLVSLRPQSPNICSNVQSHVSLSSGAGEAVVLATFMVSVGKKKLPVAGCRVQKGVLDRGHNFKLVRGLDTIWEGSLIALKHHKDEVPTVKVGMECGLSVEEDVDFRPGDVMVCYKNETSPQVTSWNPGF
ncbi:translation initiation factor IF-2, mitochondrial-like [Cynoglossus semilaevis]|uniref:translation initiation factor IF-2, mitochondrial-like n=1 Tax=Cynoglossus semilaevis TaxID=244447 RepID=UPI00049615B4|nr:translation initiation factor IF-2, mitochondrial-like [Cynoglossus semilaevis]